VINLQSTLTIAPETLNQGLDILDKSINAASQADFFNPDASKSSVNTWA
jgi:hypothetical protein